MRKKYKIIPDLKKKSRMTLHSSTIQDLDISDKGNWFVRFGLQANEVKLETSDEITANEIRLSLDIIDRMRIPLDCNYEIILHHNELIVGPYIGILAKHEQSSLEDWLYSSFSKFIYNYDQIGGAVLIFSLEGVDPEKDVLEGFMYNPVTDKWEKGLYKYPASIFKSINIRKELRNYFQTKYGNRIFNIYNFNKWQMYDWLSTTSAIREHLPETALYKNTKVIEKFLENGKDIYIKPIYGSQGRDIFAVRKMNDKYMIFFEEDGAKQDISVTTASDVLHFLEGQLKRRAYIVQEAIDLKMINGRIVDYRLILVKDQTGEWIEAGTVGRLGKEGSITSNISTGGDALMGVEVLKKSFGIDAPEAFRLQKKMTQVAVRAANGLEKSGVSCGNLGVDIVLDNNQRIWIIEMNNINPNATIMNDAGQPNMYYKIRYANMLYAKKLAGFSEEGF